MRPERNSGVALIIVLCLVLLLVISAVSFLMSSTSEMKMVRTQDNSTKAFYLAEAGFERARYDLNQDDNWADGNINGISCGPSSSFYSLPYTSTSLGGGSYSVRLQNIPEGTGYKDDEIWVKASGTYSGSSRAVQAKLTSSRIFDELSGNVDSAIEAQGTIEVTGSAEVNGDIVSQSDATFEDTFGLSKAKIEEITRKYFPDTYYTEAFENQTATEITWVHSPDEESMITTDGWTGNGILIVEGDLKITGGTFNGIIWVIGNLDMSGNPKIYGGIFVESGVSINTKVTGNPEVNFSPDDCDDAFQYLKDSVPGIIEDWEEVAP